VQTAFLKSAIAGFAEVSEQQLWGSLYCWFCKEWKLPWHYQSCQLALMTNWSCRADCILGFDSGKLFISFSCLSSWSRKDSFVVNSTLWQCLTDRKDFFDCQINAKNITWFLYNAWNCQCYIFWSNNCLIAQQCSNIWSPNILSLYLCSHELRKYNWSNMAGIICYRDQKVQGSYVRAPLLWEITKQKLRNS
jgi:hypothetical protein